MYPLHIPHRGNCHQPSCPRNALLQLEQVTNTLLSPHRWSRRYMADAWKYALSSRRRFLLLHPIVNDVETSFWLSKLIVRTLIDSMVFSHTLLSQSEWWYWYVQGDISLLTSFWWLLFERVRKVEAYCSGVTSGASLAKSTRAADWWSASLVVSDTEEGLKHANTYGVDCCFWDLKLLDCLTLNVVRFLVAILGLFVNIDWVGVLAKNSAAEWIAGNIPPIFLHPDDTHLTLLLVASINEGPVPLLHLGVA